MAEAIWTPTTLPQILDRAVRENPNGQALACGGLTLSYAQYGRAVDSLAACLAAADTRGRPVALLMPNSIEIAVATFAIHKAGAIVVALNPDYTAHELEPILADCMPSAMLCAPGCATKAMQSLPDRFSGEVLVLPEDTPSWLDSLYAQKGDAPAPPQPSDIATLQYTGGTTGRAKGVMLTHQAIAANIAQREQVLPTQFGNERVLCLMPLYHSFALAMGLHLAAFSAGCLHILPRYRPDWVVQALRQDHITRLPAGPTVFNSLLSYDDLKRADTATLRSCYSGSAPLSLSTLERWEALTGAPIFEGYGQSEAGPILTYQSENAPRKQGSVGKPLPRTGVEIVDPVSGQGPLPNGQTGEIRARGPQLMQGYLNRAAETAEALREGWLYTGDIGHLDSDGDLFIDDRKKDMVIVGGYNVYPREVDEVLMAHPTVRQAATIGVTDAYRGEVLWSFVMTIEGMDLSAEMLLAHCRASLVKYKWPVRFEFVQAIPLTSVGKIDKTALRQLAANGMM
jgi:long-chain acyl-CoA synthetase